MKPKKLTERINFFGEEGREDSAFPEDEDYDCKGRTIGERMKCPYQNQCVNYSDNCEASSCNYIFTMAGVFHGSNKL
jgi:hypothetical protein